MVTDGGSVVNATVFTAFGAQENGTRVFVKLDPNTNNCEYVTFVESIYLVFTRMSRGWGLRTQKLKSHLLRTHSLKVFPLKPGVGLYTAMRATLTARNFFLAYFYPSGPFTCIFSKTSPKFFLC